MTCMKTNALITVENALKLVFDLASNYENKKITCLVGCVQEIAELCKSHGVHIVSFT